MVTLTQSNQLSQIPGSAGQQSVIQDQSPTAGDAVSGLVKSATTAYDVAGDIYAKNQSRTIVNEELENVDKAIALAEQKKKNENFVEPEEMPVSDAEFTVIENAVRSGAMSREKARLLASSRLRTRISEQPFFAGKLRQAASEVVGFNIESEPARQYFAAFQTEAQLGQGSKNKYMQDKMDQAAAIAPVVGSTQEEVYQDLILRDELKARKEAALARQELGAASDIDTFTKFNQANSEVRFTNILGTFREQFGETGSVDEASAEIILAEAEAAEIAELTQIWTGDQVSTEFQRARDTISAEYDQIRDYANAVGFDNLNKISIQRNKDRRTLIGDRLYSVEKMIAENLGQQVFVQATEVFSRVTDPSRLEAMFRSNPTLGRVGALMGNPTAQEKFGNQIADVYEDISQGRPVRDGTNEDTGTTNQALADTILSDMFNSGPEGEESAVEYLKEQGLEVKTISLLSTKAPGRATDASKQYFRAQFNNALPQVTERLAGILAVNPDLEWSIEEDGQINLVAPRPSENIRGGAAMRADIRRTQRAMASFDEAQELVEHINLYGEGINKGWGQVVGSSPQKYRKQLADMVDQGFIQQSNVFAAEAQNLILEGDVEAAEEQFSGLKRTNPNYSNYTFEQFQEAIRRRNNLGE